MTKSEFTTEQLIDVAVCASKGESVDMTAMCELNSRYVTDTVLASSVNKAVRDAGGSLSRLSSVMDATVEEPEEQVHVTTKNGKTVPVVNVADVLISADAVEEQEVDWTITNYMPRGQLTILAGDGGEGKTTVACDIVAEVTTGKHSILTADILPEGFTSAPENVLYLSGEDDFSRVLRKKLRIAGVDLKKVYSVPITAEIFPQIKFNSEILRKLIEECHPGLVVFDPVQQFVPADIQMGWRNAMRQCLSVLVGFGERYGTSFLIICHSNKQSGLSGRKRIAESADLWDISRSVLMVGDTGEGKMKYLSHEKSNYGELQQTILYELNEDGPVFCGRSNLRDADFVRKDRLPRPAPARAEAKHIILETLKENGGQMKASDLDGVLIGQGVSAGTLKRAKAELKREKIIRYWKDGFETDWNVSFVQVKDDSYRKIIQY